MEKRKHPRKALFVPIHENVYIIDVGAGVNGASHPLTIHW
jgi:arylamine N-acetyltransferase